LLANDDDFAGCRPYHGDCLEGLAAGLAIQQRWGTSLSDLPHDHVAHTPIADYLGQACAMLALTLSVGRSRSAAAYPTRQAFTPRWQNG
jgi:fructokinase